MINIGNVEVMRTIRLIALAFCLATPAMAASIVPEEYQGVWAAARDCKDNFQNVLSNVVNREFAACRVMQVLNAGHPESRTNTIYLNCGGSQSREIWHEENIEGTDYLVIIQIEGREAGRPSIDMYKRCPEIPFSEIPLSDILEIRSKKKKSRRHRAPFKWRASPNFRIREQPGSGNTALDKKKNARTGRGS